jgi:hypothetical protein
LVPPSEHADGGPLLFAAILSVVVFVGAVVASRIRHVKTEDRDEAQSFERPVDRAA